ncbi:hypothetical protein ACJX0J_015250, partial [Zea mays]
MYIVVRKTPLILTLMRKKKYYFGRLAGVPCYFRLYLLFYSFLECLICLENINNVSQLMFSSCFYILFLYIAATYLFISCCDYLSLVRILTKANIDQTVEGVSAEDIDPDRQSEAATNIITLYDVSNIWHIRLLLQILLRTHNADLDIPIK